MRMDDVQEHSETHLMRFIDQGFKLLRRACSQRYPIGLNIPYREETAKKFVTLDQPGIKMDLLDSRKLLPISGGVAKGDLQA